MSPKKIINIVITSVFTLFGVIGTIIVPKSLITVETIEKVCAPFISTDDDNLVYTESKVYAVESKMSSNYKDDIWKTYEKYSTSNDFMVVKLPSSYQVDSKNQFVVVYDNSVESLCIDFYVAKNIVAEDLSVPVKTILSSVDTIAKPVNKIYKLVISFLTISYFALVLGIGLKSIFKKDKSTKKE